MSKQPTQEDAWRVGIAGWYVIIAFVGSLIATSLGSALGAAACGATFVCGVMGIAGYIQERVG